MTGKRWVARAGLTLLATIAVAAVATPAQASSTGDAYVSGATIHFAAGGQAKNKVVITFSGRTVTIDDKYRIKPNKGCKQVKGDKTRVRCTTKKKTSKVVVTLYDRNDSVVNKGNLRMEADGGAGNDKITGGPKADVLMGDDVFTRYSNGNDKLYGAGGNDEIYAGDGSDYVNAGTGNDSVWDDAVCECYGPHRPGNDVIYLGHGHDLAAAGKGHDKIYGGPGNDSMFAGPGRDRLEGGSGNDYLTGDDGSGTAAADVLLGGPGTDRVTYQGYKKPVAVSLDGLANDGIAGERDNVGTDVEDIEGGDGNDRLAGNAGANVIDGFGGDDVILGGGGNDELLGSYGRNKLYGEAGNDALYTSSSSGKNTVDGGANQDKCYVLDSDTVVNCEELSNA
jgi:serralysin